MKIRRTSRTVVSHLGIFESFGVGMRAVVNLLQHLRAFAEMLVRVGEVDSGADERHVRLVVDMSFA